LGTAHIIEEATRALGTLCEAILTEEEMFALDGKVFPEGVII
jgi:hypothetical protein